MEDNIKYSLILVRCGEIALKGMNRHVFESRLIFNIKKALEGMREFKVWRSQSRFYIEPEDSNGMDAVEANNIIKRIVKVFGIVSVSPVISTAPDFDSIKKLCIGIADRLSGKKNNKTFKVESRRGDKSFPMTSNELSAELGACILKNSENLSVDVHEPDFTIFVEVREKAYVYYEIIPAFGGMPSGTAGKGLLLLSGGIDSPVAGWMIAKRGMAIDAVHFFSYPYTGLRSKEKVIELARILSEYTGSINLIVVPFTGIQEEIRDKCPNDHITIITRRFMMRIAEKLAFKNDINALITGESLGQVASQTIEGLSVTDAAVNIPVFRPLIGMDKNEVVNIAKRIGTYDTSILPYEDCCTIFNSKRPSTKPRIDRVARFEESLDADLLIDDAISKIETVRLKSGGIRK